MDNLLRFNSYIFSETTITKTLYYNIIYFKDMHRISLSGLSDMTNHVQVGKTKVPYYVQLLSRL